LKTDFQKRTNMARNATTDAPAHLRPATAAWFDAVVRDYELEEHHRMLLQAASEAWDAAQVARETIAREGAVYVDRFGAPRSHPAVAHERDARIQFTRCLRELALDLSEPPTETRPPRAGGQK
jgi:phage terminase small subunit